MKWSITLGLFFLALFLVGCSDTTGNVIKLTNPIQTCKMVDVPYQAIEEYQVPMKFEVVSTSRTTTLHGFDVWAVGEVTIRNVDSETGQFTVTQTFDTLNDPAETLSTSQYIMSGESKKFKEEYDIDMSEDVSMKYTVQPPSKTLTRTVTKYRSEEVCE